MRLTAPTIALTLAVAAASAAAQQTGATRPPPDTMTILLKSDSALRNSLKADFTVKTVALHHLSSFAAVRLLSPYALTPGGGVFEVPNIRAVTIREVPRIYDQMMGVLEKYDREPATVVLNFQLVSAEQTNMRDPAVAGIDSLLRGVLKYSGYRLLGTAIATVGEDRTVEQTLAASGETLTLRVTVSDVRVDGNSASVNLNVELLKPALPATSQVQGRNLTTLLQTGVTVPIGQTVLLGTSAVDHSQRALILTVRPQIAKR